MEGKGERREGEQGGRGARRGGGRELEGNADVRRSVNYNSYPLIKIIINRITVKMETKECLKSIFFWSYNKHGPEINSHPDITTVRICPDEHHPDTSRDKHHPDMSRDIHPPSRHVHRQTPSRHNPRPDMSREKHRPDMSREKHRHVKPPGPCPGDRSRVPHARSSVRPAPINAPALSTPTWPALYNIPLLDRSFAGRRDDKTFTIHGESAAASEGRRYIVMDKSMHVSHNTCESTMAHVIRARVCPILLVCAWANTDMCQILRKYDTKSRTVHSCPALYDNKVASGVRVCLRTHSKQCA